MNGQGVSPLTNPEEERAVFQLLWDMVKACDRADGRDRGTIIGRHASMIDDRIENSGYSRSVDSLKFYTAQQLKDELAGRWAASPSHPKDSTKGQKE